MFKYCGARGAKIVYNINIWRKELQELEKEREPIHTRPKKGLR